ncbi:hypothetical protein WCE55_02835 [Luteimonas sp. MJ293]
MTQPEGGAVIDDPIEKTSEQEIMGDSVAWVNTARLGGVLA